MLRREFFKDIIEHYREAGVALVEFSNDTMLAFGPRLQRALRRIEEEPVGLLLERAAGLSSVGDAAKKRRCMTEFSESCMSPDDYRPDFGQPSPASVPDLPGDPIVTLYGLYKIMSAAIHHHDTGRLWIQKAEDRAMTSDRLSVVWDMETADPDDFLTLLLLLGHPRVRLRAVTVTPGSAHQVGLVRRALSWFGVELPVGAYNLDHPKRSVSDWHYRAYGEAPPSRDAEPGFEVLLRCCDDETTLITGAPLKNLGKALEGGGSSFRLGRLVAQGGFAGEGVVAPEKQLAKFRGRRTCPTYNLGGAPKAALAALASPNIGVRRFVSKNVCHGVVYDGAFHRRVKAEARWSKSLELISQGMERYLERRPGGKKLHDPLAACCAVDERIGEWAEVEIYRVRDEWGARLAPGSGTWIIVGHDKERFVRTFLAHHGRSRPKRGRPSG